MPAQGDLYLVPVPRLVVDEKISLLPFQEPLVRNVYCHVKTPARAGSPNSPALPCGGTSSYG